MANVIVSADINGTNVIVSTGSGPAGAQGPIGPTGTINGATGIILLDVETGSPHAVVVHSDGALETIDNNAPGFGLSLIGW